MKDIPDGSVDLILCDLPYGTTACTWDIIIPFNELWEQYNRVIKENGAIALFSAQPFTTKLIHSNIKNFRYTWYWKKRNVTGFSYARYQPMRCIEDICVFYKKHPTYNPQGLVKLEKPLSRKAKTKKEGVYDSETLSNPYETIYTNYPRHFIEFPKEVNNVHPTQKPVSLLEYLIRTYTNTGDTVLDNCMGSGSTGVACMNTGRKFIGFELNDKFYNIAKQRITNAVFSLHK
jgi:site-specific DNA-methyltransferase (adenine-specific)